ncbi:hypothetical protein MFMK1_002262 [Metallumcola ferriviriculae]|uniref:Com family DNA-binding transcriptional regulator n=1 Tax=Metallumcola ferriviriculae TaxID=3039180 RepID=A0AAU0UM60_9FIRM|nr:hypothetical protein MFMK1_002262 [Desulfitibacteraceae bacterium MK1]
MQDIRCVCNKIICQVDEGAIVIKCRHCKRFIIIRTHGDVTVETSVNDKKVNMDYKKISSL